MHVSGIEIEVVKKYIKNMHLNVLPPSGRVRISAPSGTSNDAIIEVKGSKLILKLKLPPLVKKWEGKIGVKANTVGVKNMLTRWGTCNPENKRVLVNLQLAKKPVKCLEYIVIHGLVHLREKTHTNRFAEHMDTHMPDWRVAKDELNSFIMDRYMEE